MKVLRIDIKAWDNAMAQLAPAPIKEKARAQHIQLELSNVEKATKPALKRTSQVAACSLSALSIGS